jgi:hypothetical protein
MTTFIGFNTNNQNFDTQVNRLVYYPTGCYGTFLQWLCNTPADQQEQNLPFDTDGNSHGYVLSDQYKLLITVKEHQDYVSAHNSTVVSSLWPAEHNGKLFNAKGSPNFYVDVTLDHLQFFQNHPAQVCVIYPTVTSKIWWWHNNCKKVIWSPEMFDKKVNSFDPGSLDVEIMMSSQAWLTTVDPIERAKIQMSYYQPRAWYQRLMTNFQCDQAQNLSLGQLRTTMAQSIRYEFFDYVSHWALLPAKFPNMKFISLDQLRDNLTESIQHIFDHLAVKSSPSPSVLSQWYKLQTTMHRDQEHHEIIQAITQGQDKDWSELNFDIFDEVYLLYELVYKNKLQLNVHHLDKLPTNTRDLLQYAH